MVVAEEDNIVELVVDVVVSTSNYSTYPTFSVDLYSNSPREESIVDF